MLFCQNQAETNTEFLCFFFFFCSAFNITSFLICDNFILVIDVGTSYL